MATHCTTEQFWQRMCDYRFIRTSRHTGLIEGEEFITDLAPEDVAGFLDEKRSDIERLLGAKHRSGEPTFGLLARWIAAFYARRALKKAMED